ncbi:DNA polymerase eta [Wyeomyia smithii]|uniref:DNA polymerase eta n=1 Tax=Wyeomyia smithii TaxID=174621 RepID=UPI002467BAF1|nr:DNA polymerase eta [Wyeomyia smithii]XP_055551667.1 DNA polymerase eta [Wyeomyia smithii]
MSKQLINIANKYDRVVVLVDMDCFYCQVEEKYNPDIRGKPIAVVQYNPWQGGGIIAVNYPARAKGVTRHMRGDEAKQHCPEIVLPQVPQVRGKADISKYRDAGKEVAAVLQTFTPLLERASVDEAYMDITERVLARLRDMNEGKFQLLPEKLLNTFAVGYDSIGEFVQKISCDLDEPSDSQEMESEEDRVALKKSDIKLLIGASIVNEIRDAVKQKTGYECSAGIAHNKILAKLTAGFHKPNKQTILPLKSINKMYETLSIKKVKGLGGKLGDQVCELLKIQFMSELAKFPEKLLQSHFEERMGSWMFLIARGIDLEAVTPKFNSKSIGCCKRFPGKNAILGLATLKHWLGELASEIQERLEKDMDENGRVAKQLTVSYAQQIGENDVSSTRSVPLAAYDAERIAADALDAIRRNTEFFLKSDNEVLNNPIKFLGISAGKFEDNRDAKKNDLKLMFSNMANKAAQEKTTINLQDAEVVPPEKCVEKKNIKSFFKTPARAQDAETISKPKSPVPCENDLTSNEIPEISIAVEENEDKFLNDTIPFEKAGSPHITSTSTLNSTETGPDIKQESSCLRKEDMTSQTAREDYRQTYAEFCRAPDLQQATEPCPDCSKAIPVNQIQSHRDFHLALQLSQQQREEYRNELKSKFASPSVKPKAAPRPTVVAKNTQINKFLVTAAVQNGPASAPEASAPCSECGKTIASDGMQEHLDYHTARKLQLELNQMEMRTVTSSAGTQLRKESDGSGSKRKRPPASGSLKSQPAKVNNLNTYFTRM